MTLRAFNQGDVYYINMLLSDPKVTDDLGGPFSNTQSTEKLHDFIEASETHGYARMAVIQDGEFAGYVGVMHNDTPGHPFGPHDEIGWRLLPSFWGKGIALQAARLAVSDSFYRVGLPHVLAYTTASNLRSQAVMTRLGMTRMPDLDFEEHYPPIGAWKGLVWRISAEDHRAGGIE